MYSNYASDVALCEVSENCRAALSSTGSSVGPFSTSVNTILHLKVCALCSDRLGL